MSPQDKELWKSRWDSIVKYVREMPPLLIAFVLLILVNIPISFLSVKLGVVNQAEREFLKQYIEKNALKDLFYYTVLLTPMQESICYLGIGRLVIFLLPPDTKPRKVIAWI